MTYTLNNLIKDLKEQNQDLPIILSHEEYPQCFKTLYINQLHLEITSHNMQSVGEFLKLAEQFSDLEKEVSNKSIHLQKIFDNKVFRFYVSGLEEHYGNVYIKLEDID